MSPTRNPRPVVAYTYSTESFFGWQTGVISFQIVIDETISDEKLKVLLPIRTMSQYAAVTKLTMTTI